MATKAWWVLAVAGTLTAGCAGARKESWEKQPPPKTVAAQDLDDAAKQQLAENQAKLDDAWANRGEQPRLEEAIATLQELIKVQPTAERYTHLSRAYFFLAESAYSLDESMKAKMQETYDLGTKAGGEAVRYASPEFADAVANGSSWEDAVTKVGPDAVPALYWYASNLGKWARAEGFTTILANRDRIKSTMTKCLELDPDYFYGAPHRYFGAYYAIAPAFAGGDMTKSENHFKQSLARAPNYLATKVLMADAWATKKGDRARFESLLKDVLAADVNVLPDIVPEQTLEKKKAEALLKKVDDLF